MPPTDVPLENRFYTYPHRSIIVPDFPAEGPILDVGGGGEGVIGRLKGRQVIAIDRLKSELEEAPAGPLKIVMDATCLQFLDEAFDTATLFYALMFVPTSNLATVCAEIFRVLRPGGRLLVWDALLPVKPAAAAAEQDIAVFPFTFQLPAQTVQTAFGASWPSQTRDAACYRALAQAAGFRIVETREDEGNFFLLVQKPV